MIGIPWRLSPMQEKIPADLWNNLYCDEGEKVFR